MDTLPRLDTSPSSTARNIFGDPLDICVLGAPGYRDSCPFGNDDLTQSFLCVLPEAIQANPFCVEMEKFGRYLKLRPEGPATAAAAGELVAKCRAVPSQVLYSSFVASHWLEEEYAQIALHLCQYCLLESQLSPGPAQFCWTLAQGTSTITLTATISTTLTTTTIMYFKAPKISFHVGLPSANGPSFTLPQPRLPALPSGKKVFWPTVAVLTVCWLTCLCFVPRSPPEDSEPSSDEESSARSRRRPARQVDVDFSGVWEMLGQAHLITDSEIRWQDRKVTHIRVTSPSSFSAVINGQLEEARLDADGQRLVWSDGAVWSRAEESTPLLGGGRRK